MRAQGGTISQIQTATGVERVHVFNSSGSFRVLNGGKCRILIIGAGADGGTGLGSASDDGKGWRIAAHGGGGGGFYETTGFLLEGGNYTITVGAGSGANSSAFGITVNGGNGGNSGAPTAHTGGQVVARYGSTRFRNASGAGSSENGTDSKGGEGTSSDITGTSVVYCSGGGRGGQSSDSGQGYVQSAPGGTNAGRGRGEPNPQSDAVANTGSGGGGGAMHGDGGVDGGGKGAAGKVVIRYALTGGTISMI